MITVHVVFNAHLDPIWLWPWPVGLDSALATCRSACDRLDAHPDVIFTRGEAWVYDMIRRTDPLLFERILAHQRAGRWEIVGGWWVQPDCNLPSGWGLARQIALGQAWFQEHCGTAPDIAYNVDSFGHTAALPRLLREGGQSRYIMMRPQAHEMRLPARLFRWRGQVDGPAVTVFRLARYNSHQLPTLDDVRQAASDLPAGVTDTMFFAGLGDHGGGPTEETIAWVRQHRDAIPGCRLEFSSPARFFAAVAAHDEALPEVVGELQHHAIGCYSVERGVKTAVRRAEHRLAQAGAVVGEQPALEQAWRTVCFHQFHDTLGGTCLPSAYVSIYDQLGGAAAAAEEALVLHLRRTAAALPADPCQRLLIQNASEQPFEGLVAAEAWMERQAWQPHWRLLDEQDQAVPWQLIDPEATLPAGLMASLLFPQQLAAGALATLRIDTAGGPPAVVQESVVSSAGGLRSGSVGWSWDGSPLLDLGALSLPWPQLSLVEDLTDTWSHAIDRYPEGPAESAVWERPTVIEHGPLRATAVCHGRIGRSELFAELLVAARSPWAELLLRVDWRETRRVLKLVVSAGTPLTTRWDGIPGEALERRLDGVERPLRDFTLLGLADGHHLGIVCPDVFALDATPQRARLTLLRSPLLAHHDFAPQARPRAQVADRGEHLFRFALAADPTVAALDRRATQWQRPPLLATATHGMPAWPNGPKF